MQPVTEYDFQGWREVIRDLYGGSVDKILDDARRGLEVAVKKRDLKLAKLLMRDIPILERLKNEQ